MNKILIIYPSLFRSYTKFSRKIKRILSNQTEVELLYTDDANEFIAKVSQEIESIKSTRHVSSLSSPDITHAIVFDDGEEFKEELEHLKNHSIPLRSINISITRVINLKREEKYKGLESTKDYEYIGRGSYWGNPYSMYEEGDEREEVIRKYKYDFDFEKFPNKDKKEVYKLAGKRLGCFCKPAACHGDVLADYLNAWDDGK